MRKGIKGVPELLAVSKRAGKAIMDYDMLRDGDRVAVAVSGGKDSLSLLHVLRDRQRVAPIHFEFVAVHIDFCFSDFDPAPLIAYLEREGFAYLVEKAGSLSEERWEEIDCFRWSRHRRTALFDLADRQGFNKIAFGHHMDDIAETILLNQFYRGEIASMRPKQELFDGKVTIIRPLAYEREETMIRLAQRLNITQIGQSKCANEETSHRLIIKKMLRQLEAVNPMIVQNIFKSLQNVRRDYLLEIAPAKSPAGSMKS
ncbi:MAG TPA: tRNA 2-thiocytidine(32) synthetase TtcA [Candidatus Omnitrophica bacterium]|nr:MAG: hypothetical protein A2Z81_06710 [Omnitrophica WOR_2 bacterium GWA2_45_18]HBR15090.1 tRNA 2-thiocytidine(32) synthetase TtcA [Candidatus Omnitrophota bacterium]